MKYELKESTIYHELFIDGIKRDTVSLKNGWAQVIRHLESEIKAKDERISELSDKVIRLNSELKVKKMENTQLNEKLISKTKPSEPFIFTKDTPVRLEGGEVELFWENDHVIFGRAKLIHGEWVPRMWTKIGKCTMGKDYNLIPILPEKRVVDVWVCVSDKDNQYYPFETESDAKDFVRVNVEYHIEHHKIELKGQSNV